jgi:preprotein translocase subunit SecE
MKKHLAAGGNSIVQYVKSTFGEFRQITWPTYQDVIRYTILVVVTIVIAVLILTAFDYGMQQLTNRYLLQ